MNVSPINELITDKITGEWGKEPNSSSVKVIRTTNFRNDGKLDLTSVVEREIAEKIVQKKRLQKGDIIIEKSGGSPAQPVGRVVYFDVDDGETYLCNNFTSILRPSVKVNSKYLFFALYYLHLSKKTLKYQNKTTGIINLQLDRYINSEKVNSPSIDEQLKIVSYLDQADTLRQKRKQAIDLLDEYLKSTFLEMFGDPVTNSKNWAKKTLHDFGGVITGNTPSRAEKNNYSDNYIEWIKTDNIVEGKMYITPANEYLSEKGLKKARFVTSGAVLMACIAGSVESIGRVALADRKVSFNQQINAIQPNEKVNSIYLYWLFRITKSYIQEQATRGMKKILTKGEFEKIEMILPPKELQDKFEQIAFDVDNLKQKMNVQSDEMDNQFKALMQKHFNSN